MFTSGEILYIIILTKLVDLCHFINSLPLITPLGVEYLMECIPALHKGMQLIYERRNDMTAALTSIISAVITGVLALVGVIMTNSASNHKFENQLQVSQAITNTKLDGLTEEVRRQNSVYQRIPGLEQQISDIAHRLNKIEDKVK